MGSKQHAFPKYYKRKKRGLFCSPTCGCQQRLDAWVLNPRVNMYLGTRKAKRAALHVPINYPESPPQQSALKMWPFAAVWLSVGDVSNILSKQQLFITYFYLFTYGWILGSQHQWWDTDFSQQIPQPWGILDSLHFSNNTPNTNPSFSISWSIWAQHTATTLYLL